MAGFGRGVLLEAKDTIEEPGLAVLFGIGFGLFFLWRHVCRGHFGTGFLFLWLVGLAFFGLVFRVALLLAAHEAESDVAQPWTAGLFADGGIGGIGFFFGFFGFRGGGRLGAVFGLGRGCFLRDADGAGGFRDVIGMRFFGGDCRCAEERGWLDEGALLEVFRHVLRLGGVADGDGFFEHGEAFVGREGIGEAALGECGHLQRPPFVQTGG